MTLQNLQPQTTNNQFLKTFQPSSSISRKSFISKMKLFHCTKRIQTIDYILKTENNQTFQKWKW